MLIMLLFIDDTHNNVSVRVLQPGRVGDTTDSFFRAMRIWMGTELIFGRFHMRTPGNLELAGRGRVLHMGGGLGDEGSGKAGFVKEPGIAQSVHWFRDRDAGLTEKLMASLIGSELQVNFNYASSF